MKRSLGIMSLQIRLLMLTVFLVVAVLSLTTQYSDQSYISDDTSQVRVYELQEANGGSEPPFENQALTKSFFFAFLTSFACILFLKLSPSNTVISNRSFLKLVRSRSPPSL